MPQLSVSERLADFVVGLHTADIPENVSHHARRALLDWYGATLAGWRLSPTSELQTLLADVVGCGRSRLLDGRLVPIASAALFHGVASHAAEVDDVVREAVYHPGSPTIAAALAVATAQNQTSDELIRAVVAGYETSIRIALAIFKAHYVYWHPTGTVGTIAAAAASSYLLGLNRSQVDHAIATSVTFAAGLQQAFRSESMLKPLHAGRAAEAGVTAALLAKAGVTGAQDMFEGPCGFGAAMGGSPDWEQALADLGTKFRIAEITFKNHCCCGQAFASIDAALGLKERHSIDLSQIARIHIKTYKTAVDVAGGFSIEGPAEARFSIPYLVAHALVKGSVRLDAAEAAARANPLVADLMRRTEISTDPAFDAVFPASRCAEVTIKTLDGKVCKHEVSTRKGDPDFPLSDAELEDKFLELSSPVIGNASAKALLAVLRREDTYSISHLYETTSSTWPS